VTKPQAARQAKALLRKNNVARAVRVALVVGRAADAVPAAAVDLAVEIAAGVVRAISKPTKSALTAKWSTSSSPSTASPRS
jgi:hypothetical protein